MAGDYFVLSNFGVRYFKLPYTDSSTVPGEATLDNELTGVLNCDFGKFAKENKKYRTLNGNGWESVAPLGNTAEDGTFECVREGTGDPYLGTAGDSTYTKVKDWFMKATEGAGVNAPACIVEVLPRGNNVYEGTLWYVVPNNWGPGSRDTESGQEYSFTVTPIGPQVPVKVTYVPATEGAGESWTLAKAEQAE